MGSIRNAMQPGDDGSDADSDDSSGPPPLVESSGSGDDMPPPPLGESRRSGDEMLPPLMQSSGSGDDRQPPGLADTNSTDSDEDATVQSPGRYHQHSCSCIYFGPRLRTHVRYPFRNDPSGCPNSCCRLYFSEFNGGMHGPMQFRLDESVEVIQERLEKVTFRSHCVEEKTNRCLAQAQISTSCGKVLTQGHNLNEYPVFDECILTVILVSADDVSRLKWLRPFLRVD